jgi:phosphoserine aminotransferase
MFENLVLSPELLPSDPRFGVGPSLVPMDYLEALLATGHHLLGTSHRQMAVRSVVKEMQDGFRKYFNLPEDYVVLIGNGGATFLFDMIGLGLVKEKSAHFTCGEFSEKWFKAHANINWIQAEQIAVPYGEGVNPGLVKGADLICCTLNETSTGVMLTELPKHDDPDVLLAVDATSGAGQIPVDMTLIDFYFFSPQKVFAGEGGTYIAFMSPKAQARAKEVAKLKRYSPIVMSFEHAIENSIKNQTYNTPSVINFFLINEQLKRMNALGEKKVVELAKAKAQMIYAWAQSKRYLSAFVKEEKFRSIAVATIDVDNRFNMDELAQKLRDLQVAYDIEGYRKLGRNQLRISLFHNIQMTDLKKLLDIISYAIEQNLSEI